jgi:hypothetical protein
MRREELAVASHTRHSGTRASARMARHIPGMPCDRCAAPAKAFSGGGYLCELCNEHRRVDNQIAELKRARTTMRTGR